MLKTLGKTTWDKIEVGEVFAGKFSNGNWVVEQKRDKLGNTLSLSSVHKENDFSGGNNTWVIDAEVYKLPVSVQRLWKEE